MANDDKQKCTACHGHGCDPMSDVMHWLPCTTCKGSGFATAGLKREGSEDFKTVAIMIAGGRTADRVICYDAVLEKLKELGCAIEAKVGGVTTETIGHAFGRGFTIKVKLSVN